MPPKSLGSGGGGGEENKPILVCVSFRATTGHDRPVTHAIASMPSARVDVPVIDLRDSDEVIVPTLRNACTDVGFFYVVGHGVCVWVCVSMCCTDNGLCHTKACIQHPTYACVQACKHASLAPGNG